MGKSASPTEFRHQLSPPPFDGFQASLDLPGLPVEIGQFLLELLPAQVVLPALLPDQGFNFVPQQPKPRVAVHVVLLELQLARANGGNNFLLSQAKLLPSRLVAQLAPLPTQIDRMIHLPILWSAVHPPVPDAHISPRRGTILSTTRPNAYTIHQCPGRTASRLNDRWPSGSEANSSWAFRPIASAANSTFRRPTSAEAC